MTGESQTDGSLPTTVAVATAIGLAIYSAFLLAGIIIADWSLQDFLGHLTPPTLGWLLLASAIVIAVFALPIIAYRYYRVISPLVVLVVTVVGWLVLGIGQGIPATAFFGLSYYAFAFSPVYILLYLVSGGVEYRNRP